MPPMPHNLNVRSNNNHMNVTVKWLHIIIKWKQGNSILRSRILNRSSQRLTASLLSLWPYYIGLLFALLFDLSVIILGKTEIKSSDKVLMLKSMCHVQLSDCRSRWLILNFIHSNNFQTLVSRNCFLSFLFPFLCTYFNTFIVFPKKLQSDSFGNLTWNEICHFCQAPILQVYLLFTFKHLRKT